MDFYKLEASMVYRASSRESRGYTRIWMVSVLGEGWGVGMGFFFPLTLISGIENSQQGKTSRTLGTGRKSQLPGTEQSLAVHRSLFHAPRERRGKGQRRMFGSSGW